MHTARTQTHTLPPPPSSLLPPPTTTTPNLIGRENERKHTKRTHVGQWLQLAHLSLNWMTVRRMTEYSGILSNTNFPETCTMPGGTVSNL